MKKIISDKTYKGHSLIKVLVITVIALEILVSIAGAAPFAYITSWGEGSGILSVIDTATDNITATVPVGKWPYTVAVNSAGTKAYVVNAGSNAVSVIDTTINKVTATVNVGAYPWEVAINPAGTKAYVTNWDSNTVSVIDTATNQVTATVSSVGRNPLGVTVSPDGKKVYVTTNTSNNVYVIDTSINKVIATVPVGVGHRLYGVVVNPAGTKIYVVGSESGNVYVIDTSTNKVIGTVSVGSVPTGIAVSRDGTNVYVVAFGNPGTLSVIDTASNEVTATVNVGMQPYGVAVTPDKTKVYVTNMGVWPSNPSNTVSVIDTATNTVTDTIRVGTAPWGVAISPQPELILPVITWGKPADVVYGAALGSTQLSASTSVPGTFIYTPSTGTVLNAGTQTLHVDFTPMDAANYNTASKDITINVLKATPTISWNNLEDIVYGKVLSSTQLDATSSVLGTFAYTPASGTLLSAGTQTLKVDFTPADSANYNSVSQTTTINVLTHLQKIQQIINMVQSLNLDQGQANSLIVKLNAATQNLNDKSTPAATNELNAFINEVEADIQSGKLTSTEGQALIDDANAVINEINYVLNPPSTSVPEFPSIALPVAAFLGLVLILGRKKND